jgi:small neutral amino acid transporter SnatA (MarC family)
VRAPSQETQPQETTVQLAAIAIPASLAVGAIKLVDLTVPAKYNKGVIGVVIAIAAAGVGLLIANQVSKALGAPKGIAPAASVGK